MNGTTLVSVGTVAAAPPGWKAPRAQTSPTMVKPRRRMAHMLAEGVICNTLQSRTPLEGRTLSMEFGQVAPLALVSRILVAVGWAGFFIFFFSRAKLAGQNETKRAPASVFGIALQMVGFALVWMLQRKPPAAGVP